MPNLVSENIYINALLFVIGLYVLTKSSDKFVDAATIIAEHFHISEIVIGLTLVSIGTSLPELATNIYSASCGNTGVAIGNALGSNITNILLALGAVLLIREFPVSRTIFLRDGVVMGVTFAIFAIFAYSGTGVITHWQGVLMLLSCIAYIYYLVKHVKPGDIEEVTKHNHLPGTMLKAVTWLVVTVFLITFGAKLMVDNIVWGAVKFNIPKSIISATIIAIGTSLPEVAVSISGVKKCKPDIVIGNIIGSCIFNILLVMGATSTIHLVTIDKETSTFLLPFMLVTGATCLIFMRLKWKLCRWHGVVLLTMYVLFLTINVLKIIK